MTTTIALLDEAQFAELIKGLAGKVGHYIIVTQAKDVDIPEVADYLAKIVEVRIDGSTAPTLHLELEKGYKQTIIVGETQGVVGFQVLDAYEWRIAAQMMKVSDRELSDIVVISPDGCISLVDANEDPIDRYYAVRGLSPRHCVHFEHDAGEHDAVVYCSDPAQAVAYVNDELGWAPDLAPKSQNLHSGYAQTMSLKVVLEGWS